MATIKLNDGSLQTVDDDELRDLITAGAGEEVDQLPPAPDTVVRGVNRSGLPPVDINSQEGQARINALQNAQQYISGIGGTQQSSQDIQRAKYLALHPELQGDNTGINPNAIGYKPTASNFGKAAVDVGSWIIPGEAEYRVAASGLPLLAKPIVTGLIGAGSEVAREGFNNGSVKPIPVIASGLTSGLGGFLGGYLSSKAAGNEAQYIADKAKLAEDLQQQEGLTGSLMHGETPRGTYVYDENGKLVPPVSSIAVPNEYVGPSSQLQAAKDYMASSRFGNTIYPENISDIDAARFLGENIDKANKLKGTVITKAPLFNNQFNKASPRTLTELVKQNGLNAALNAATNFGNRYQKPIGIASGLFPSLGGPVGTYMDYRSNH